MYIMFIIYHGKPGPLVYCHILCIFCTGMPTEETPRQILFALCWRGEEGALEKVKELSTCIKFQYLNGLNDVLS